MAIIPPPIKDEPGGRTPCGVFAIVFLVFLLLMLVGVAVFALTSYRRLDAPPEMASEVRKRAAETLEAQTAAMEVYRSNAGEALAENFAYPRALERWRKNTDEHLRKFLLNLLLYPEGFPDNYWIAYANRAATTGDWPDTLDAGRHSTEALTIHAAAWLEANEDWQALREAVRHGLAWQVRDPAEEEYSRWEDYLQGADFLATTLAVASVGAARDGDRARAWDHLELLASLERQLLNEPEMHAMTQAVEMRFYADIALWALFDDGPLSMEEQYRYETIFSSRADTEPLRTIIEMEAALAPGRREHSGLMTQLSGRVRFDSHWKNQQAILDAFDTPPHEHAADHRELYNAVQVYADETDYRLRRNLYLYRIQWQSHFCWELAGLATILKTWKAEHGEYPVALEELLEAGALQQVPVDPIWDEPIHYARLDDGFALYMLRVEDWYWLYERWLDEYDPNDLDDYGLDWEVVWRATR